MSEEAEQHAAPRRKAILLPLNSRRLTAAYLQQLARALELPTAAGAEDIRQMINGMIEEMGHDPMNVQVAVEPGEDGQVLILRDLDGPFLQADPEPDPQVPWRLAPEQCPRTIFAAQLLVKETPLSSFSRVTRSSNGRMPHEKKQ